MQFELLHTSKKSKARVGRIHTAHGIIDTPGFVAVGTNGTLKSLCNQTVNEIGLQLMFCNTYHLLLQPGTDVIQKAGGLHKFIGRNMPIITDSGGFQVFSLAYGGYTDELKSRGTKKNDSSVIKITEDGVLFRSYRDGSKVLLTPEKSVEAQKALGADIIIPFDELPPYHIDPKELERSLDRTHIWEKRSLDAHLQNPMKQAMYAVIHGGLDPRLRQKSADYLSTLPFDGYAIGGSMGKTKEEMYAMLQKLLPHLPTDKPNHLLGIADLPSLDNLIPLGIDTFDSSYPTKAARHGTALTKQGHLKITKSGHKHLFEPIEKDCTCHTCKNYTLAYLCHLFKASELSALTLVSIHNLHFMVEHMAQIREKILQDQI
ncbi:MAG: Queuine tRNA-ribosyltransferase [Chlamydiia bacterium]|nr:Queuine tRNA-ribosyltransferase [Chlamydiia bacterium]MCH9616010.1 Queuine tRNA-ribosyltransferase [Chlamydiia bacterium]MCH9629033.1 Queuine tRNA-ribosyltransferase [Chlamydiia bacterium]